MIGHKELIQKSIKAAEGLIIEALKHHTMKDGTCSSVDVYWYVRDRADCKISAINQAILKMVRMLKSDNTLKVCKRGNQPALYIVDREKLRGIKTQN